MWARLETEEAATTKKEARAQAEAQPMCTYGEEEGDISSSDAMSSSEEVTSRKCLREDDERWPSKKK
jgi:hypothetical protein